MSNMTETRSGRGRRRERTAAALWRLAEPDRTVTPPNDNGHMENER